MSAVWEIGKLALCACIGAAVGWLFLTGLHRLARRLRPLARWRDRRDIRAALKRLDIRNGWIVEHGRNPAIIMLHCGSCRRVIRITDRTSHGPAADRMVDSIAKDRCQHKENQ